MLPFSTEFPIKLPGNRAVFVAEVIAWLKGISSSTVLNEGSGQVLDRENAHLRAATGEELRFRELVENDVWEAIGFRHDLPDAEGRLWRTEGVLKRVSGDADDGLVRFRTQCFAKVAGARIDSPRKPYLIKSLLSNTWGGIDGSIPVSDQPVWVTDSDDGLELAHAITLGGASRWLPIVYVSANGRSSWQLSRNDIEGLAYDLGGIAHVFVEPNRAFSYKLRSITEGRNAYGGAMGLSMPGQGIIRRYHVGWDIQNSKDLKEILKLAAMSVRSQMPVLGWDWTDLQEQALRAQRERDRSRLSADDMAQLYDEEIANLQDKIRQLEIQVSSIGIISASDSEFSDDNLVQLIGPEIYSGEISDRIRLAMKLGLNVADQVGLDERSRVIFHKIIDKLPVSPALNELLLDLSRATKDSKRVASALVSLLARHGYFEKADNKHIRLEALKGFEGLEAITLPKTPSDGRGLKNLCKQVERTLGLTKLVD
ncbi:hypothetical protein [Agrobacterium sp. 22-223-1]|nr:hypothetical protein [Agrobacterium tumefaciens]